jgi:hypothetical protein
VGVRLTTSAVPCRFCRVPSPSGGLNGIHTLRVMAGSSRHRVNNGGRASGQSEQRARAIGGDLASIRSRLWVKEPHVDTNWSRWNRKRSSDLRNGYRPTYVIQNAKFWYGLQSNEWLCCRLLLALCEALCRGRWRDRGKERLLIWTTGSPPGITDGDDPPITGQCEAWGTASHGRCDEMRIGICVQGETARSVAKGIIG